jgi:cytochrome c oxidase assembly protein subunit 11
MLMFLFGYALVPLYDVFCDITGINGRRFVQSTPQISGLNESRLINLQFTTSVAPDMPWKFSPMTKTIEVHPGENKVVKFSATNISPNTVVGQAIPSVSPGIASLYLNKVECFCFNRQELKAGEQVEMGLSFFISSDIPEDINTLTLSYTLFNVTAVNQNKQPI